MSHKIVTAFGVGLTRHYNTESSLRVQIDQANRKILYQYCTPPVVKKLAKEGVLEDIQEEVIQDLFAFSEKDPAAKSPKHIWLSYSSFSAVRLYRIAHTLNNLSLPKITSFKILARRISERAKVLTGIEIHPSAEIGKRFVVDHGWGTVIGETTIIGDDCYILQGIVLGANGIAGNETTKRHPTLGNRVELGSFVRVFGSVSVGNDVKVSPYAVINEDIPDKSKVLVRTTNQIIQNY